VGPEKPPDMTEQTVSRTLVKSPPELWAEVSDPGSLARHLGEFGEIRITRLEGESTVAWEGERASGTVELAPSGWGTRVTLTARTGDAEESEAEPVAVAVEPEPVAVEPEPVAVEPEPIAVEPEPEPVAEPEQEPIAERPRAGLFSRLFRRRRAEPADEPVADVVDADQKSSRTHRPRSSSRSRPRKPRRSRSPRTPPLPTRSPPSRARSTRSAAPIIARSRAANPRPATRRNVKVASALHGQACAETLHRVV